MANDYPFRTSANIATDVGTPDAKAAKNVASASADAVRNTLHVVQTQVADLHLNVIPHINVGIVRISLPATNTFRVWAQGGLVDAVAMCQGSSRINGVRSPSTYLPGTWVLMLALPARNSDPALPSYIILGELSGLAQDPGMAHVFNVFGASCMRGGLNADQAVDYLNVGNLSSSPVLARDFGWGKPLDSLPGRYTLQTAMDGCLVIDDFMQMIKASELAKIQLFPYEDTIRVVSDHFEHYGTMFERRIARVGYGVTEVECYHLTLREALGGLTAKALVDAAKEMKPADPESNLRKTTAKQIAFPNHVKVTGMLGDGSLEYMAVPPKGEVYISDNADMAPVGTLSEEKALDGTIRVRCAREISIEKTMRVPSPKLIAPLEGAAPLEVAVRASWDQSTDIKLKSSDGMAAGLAFLRDYERFNENGNRPDMSNCPDRWVDKSVTDIYDNFNKNYVTGEDKFSETTKLAVINPNQPHYMDPARKTTIQPFRADKDKGREGDFEVYDNTAGYNILPDGSVIFHGGYGEELRFYKGNIYLSCPGDIIFQPGRDMVSMAPRHNIIKAGKGSLELTSNQNIMMASDGNVQIVAASSGQNGLLMLENKAESDISMEAFKKEGALERNDVAGGGIVIKSGSEILVDGLVTTIGSPSRFTYASVRIEAKSVTQRCVNHTTFLEESNGSMSVLTKDNVAMSLTAGGLQILCPTMNISTSMMNIIRTSAISMVDIPDHTNKTTRLAYNSTHPYIWIDGSMVVGDGIMTGNVTATGGMLNYKKDDFDKMIKSFTRDMADVETFSGAAGLLQVDSSFASLRDASPDTLSAISAAFPTTEAYQAQGFYLPMVGWHGILDKGGVWQEPEAIRDLGDGTVDTTMSFPGKVRWSEEGSTTSYKPTDGAAQTKLTQGKLSTDYVINIAEGV